VNMNVEELLRDGMERFTTGVTAPDGLVVVAVRRRRRRLTIRAAAIGGTIAAAAAVTVVLAAVTAVAARTAPAAVTAAQARQTAYVASRVEAAVDSQDLVSVATYSGNLGFPMVTYAYGPYYDWIQYNPTTDYRDRIVNGKHLWDFPPADRSKPDTANGVSLIDGKLYGVYVTYYDNRYSLTPVPKSWPSSILPKNACSTTARLEMGGVPIIGVPWPDYINGTLKCGDAVVTGNVRIGGQETTEITGKPITVPLSAGYAKSVSEKYATVTWTLYVNPVTYLPVRMYGSTDTYGGKAGNQDSAGWEDVTWLKATPANIAKAQVTIPPGFRRWTGSQQNQ
jgi:hypothetical protein